jgi:predicted metal-dependent hydrolase
MRAVRCGREEVAAITGRTGARGTILERLDQPGSVGSARYGAAVTKTPPAQPTPTTVEVRRSARRRRTVSAYRDGDRTIVLLPARMSRADEARWVDVMLARLDAQERRRGGRAIRGDAELEERAGELARRYFDGATKPSSVRWVSNQGARWGSCTPVDATIRLSDRLRAAPAWVIDYVLVHELAHLLESGHGPRFQALVDRYPKAERARGYLLGVTAAGGNGAPVGGADGDGGDDVVEDVEDVRDVEDVGDVGDTDAAAAASPTGLW